ncbi:MAG: hypothetical protein GWM98_08995, partial [Nitrospinaceae bacterium]|nr:hypothetical protein [Nitrospinaceae bacterium]NIS85020.1 hypothetical protein [Nitrospinaceae bacterium]NIT81831.1 hypothetical protein [Nitrospinaceae bacterium]NIW05690.1 hypothetical protein [Nitrospinaceae bacterium]NIX34231.1 hypothetical protein [Nitrospinaceae bacterium]
MNLGNPSMLKQAGRWATRIQTVCYEFMFRPIGPGRLAQIGHTLVLGLIYLAGAFHWAWLMNYGNVTYKYIDWQKFYDYYAVIQKALLDKAVPFFIPHFYKGTNQFLAIPETDLSPAVFLLKYMSVKEFFLTQCLILYTLGFIGGLWFRKRYRWSLFTFIFFSLLFNLNGHIVSHLAISHWPWVSYFLLPFFVAWVMKLVEGDRSLWHGTKLAWVLFGIMLLGGLHPFVWCLIFLGLLCLYQRSFIKPILMGVALGGVFSTYRFVPAFITFFGYKNEFASGFPSIPDFLASLVVIKDYNNFIGPLYGKISRIAWWELDHYVGVAGLAAILYFGIYLRIKNKNEGETHDYRVLDLS